MVTPVYIRGMILSVNVKFAGYYTPFLCLGDHGPYCRIDYGGE